MSVNMTAAHIAGVSCHSEESTGDPAGYFCTRGEKEYASIRQAIVACDD